MNKQTIDGMPREDLHELYVILCNINVQDGSVYADIRDRLRALLDAPECKTCGDSGYVVEPFSIRENTVECPTCKPVALSQGEPVAYRYKAGHASWENENTWVPTTLGHGEVLIGRKELSANGTFKGEERDHYLALVVEPLYAEQPALKRLGVHHVIGAIHNVPGFPGVKGNHIHDLTALLNGALDDSAAQPHGEVLRVIDRLESSDPDFNDCADAVRLIRELSAKPVESVAVGKVVINQEGAKAISFEDETWSALKPGTALYAGSAPADDEVDQLPAAYMYEHDGMVHNAQFQPVLSFEPWPDVKEPWNQAPLYAKPPAVATITLGGKPLGNYGAAYDGPEVRRAYTYEHQPGNIAAYRIGRAAQAIYPGGDAIDRGLELLSKLAAQGMGVFEK